MSGLNVANFCLGARAVAHSLTIRFRCLHMVRSSGLQLGIVYDGMPSSSSVLLPGCAVPREFRLSSLPAPPSLSALSKSNSKALFHPEADVRVAVVS